jgi:hypothetical protein
MPVDTVHPEYALARPQWDRIADVLDGTDAVKRSAHAYLPMLPGHREDPSSYAFYVSNAMFLNGSELTVNAFLGAVFRKAPSVEVPARVKPRLENLNGAGEGFDTFAKRAMRNVLAFGRYGLLVEAPAPGEGGGAASDPRDPAGALPWIAGYEARDIRSWRTRVVAGRPVLDQVILHEQVEAPADDEFGFRHQGRYRVLDLDDAGLYRVRLYRHVNQSYELTDTFEPRPRGSRIDYIPFTFIGPTDLRPAVTRSPILDLVDANLDHFKASAELQQARSRIAWPLPVVVSDAEPVPLRFGGDWALWLPPGSDAKFLEFSANGLSDLSAALAEKAGDMATLGARLLQQPKRAAEAAETHYLRASAENATLASCANTVSDGLKAALTHVAEWVAASGEVKVELNTDFFDVPVSPQTLSALMAAVQAGLYPMDEWAHVLKQGEMVREETTIEEFRAMLQTDQPVLLGRAEKLAEINRPPPPERPDEGDEEEDGEDGGRSGNAANGASRPRSPVPRGGSSDNRTTRQDIGPRRRTS